MKLTKITCGAALLCVLSGSYSMLGADAAADPAAAAPATAAPARGGGGGRGGGRGGRGAPMTAAETNAVAKLMELPALAPGAGDGDFSVGPRTRPPEETILNPNVPQGRLESFKMNLADSKFYPDTGKRDTQPTRDVTVYIPSQYVPGTPAPLIIAHDKYGSRPALINALNNMIADKRLPVMIVVGINHGGGDGGGSERGLEYDTVSGKYSDFVETEVLPKVEKDYNVTFSKDPDARMTHGGSSGGSAAFSMAWFHPERYHRVLIYSGTFVNAASPADPAYPHGAWEYHENIVPKSPALPLRIWMHAGQNDNQSTSSATTFRNWVIANQNMAAILKDKGYHYQFVFAKNSGHTSANAINQTLPAALLYAWKGYPIK